MHTRLFDLLAEYETNNQAARPSSAHITASALATFCERQVAYRATGAEPDDDHERTPSAATIGTMLHEAYAQMWRDRDPDAVVEVRNVHGQPDVIVPAMREVRDLKTLSAYRFDMWENNGGPEDYVWKQLQVYAYDYLHPNSGEGWTLVIDALDRESGRAISYTHPYNPDYAEACAEWVDLWNTDPPAPETLPKYGKGAPEFVCDNCEFASTCLADEEYQIEVEDVEVEEAAAAYMAAGFAERAAKDVKKKARVILEGSEGVYGDYKVKWVHRTLPARTVEYKESSSAFPKVSKA